MNLHCAVVTAGRRRSICPGGNSPGGNNVRDRRSTRACPSKRQRETGGRGRGAGTDGEHGMPFLDGHEDAFLVQRMGQGLR